ncbi:hypothetical protein COU37_03995 [Candidatus Micrarchaeota archaeon CG10_big_fil_rev_8_21_14_0_10_45_29]|nr:MAG: hypothetical protein COU37_03995 [Candidatus Micrarchaeota archaeon CG10_big_fil_rev_8_21_14_0_10_45_29]
MANTDKFDRLKHDVISHGGFFVHFHFDMHSTQKEALQEIMVGFISKLTKENGVKMCVGEVEEAQEYDGDYSTTARVSMLIEDFATLVRLTLAYTPIVVEVEEPLDAKIDAGELQNALMGISATNQELTQHILKNGMSEENRKKFEEQMARKAALGKKIKKMSEEEK